MLNWVNRYSYWHRTNSLFPHPVDDVMGPKGSWSTSFVTPRDDVSKLGAPTKGPIGPYFLVRIGVGQNHQPLKWMICGSKMTQFAICVHGEHLALNMDNGAKDRNMGISLNKKTCHGNLKTPKGQTLWRPGCSWGWWYIYYKIIVILE